MDDDDTDSQGELVVITDRKYPSVIAEQKKLTAGSMLGSKPLYPPPYGAVGVGGRGLSPGDESSPTRSPPPYPCHGEAQLSLEEKKFLLAVERGDLATVRRFAHIFFFHDFNIIHYNQLRASFHFKEWSVSLQTPK